MPKLRKGGESTSSRSIRSYYESSYPPRSTNGDLIYKHKKVMLLIANEEREKKKGKSIYPEGDGEYY